MLASPRGLSQLATSFFAYSRQGIHTHALSSLTIKFTLNTEYLSALHALKYALPAAAYWLRGGLCNFVVARQYSVVKDRTSNSFGAHRRGVRAACLVRD